MWDQRAMEVPAHIRHRSPPPSAATSPKAPPHPRLRRARMPVMPTQESTMARRAPQREAPADKSAIRPFEVSFPETDIAELRRRINATRWPERELVADQSQGVQLETMQNLARYWAKDYD